MELAQRTALEPASTESHVAAADFAVPSSDLPKLPDLDASEPTTINNNSREAREPPDAQDKVALIWPVHTEAEHAELQDAARETAPMAVFLVGALMVLLCAGAIFKLARRKTQSYRRGRRVLFKPATPAAPGQEDAG